MRLRILFLASTFIYLAAEAKEIAITFDDAPRIASGYFDGPTRAKRLIENLKKHSIDQVAFFAVSKNLDSEGRKRLEAYSDAGHLIANHTHTHPDLNNFDLSEYQNDFESAHQALSVFKTFTRWFRFPYLREGNELQKRDGMRRILADQGYLNAYITINNYDWYIEELFQLAVKENSKFDFEKLKNFYVKVLMEGIEYYDQMAIKHLGRSPKHILLLHETDVAALFIGDLATELRKRNWKIISPKEAYEDDISKYSTSTIFRFNPGRVGEIARDSGQTSGLWHETCDEKYLDDRFKKEVL